jgi:uncharacterized protein (TIGR02466 family)
MITPIFPTLLYHTKLNAESKCIEYEKLCLDVKSTNKPSGGDWQCDTFNSMGIYSPFTDERFSTLCLEITENVFKFSKEFSPSVNRLICVDSWVNISSPEDYQEYHIHPQSHFSAVFYVKFPENSGNISFMSHDNNCDMYPIPVSGDTQANAKVIEYKPSNGELIIFRSHLPHMVAKNKSKENRISISFNFCLI